MALTYNNSSSGSYNGSNSYVAGINIAVTQTQAITSLTSSNTAVIQLVSTTYAQDLKKELQQQFTMIQRDNTILANNYIHITQPEYYISSYLKLIIDVPSSNIFLPVLATDGITINIINNSSNIVSVYSQNNELIYSSLYIVKEGSTTFDLNSSNMAVLTNIKNTNNIFSWVLLLY